VRASILALLLVLCGCNGIDFGDNPHREFPKQTGPLTVPPASVRDGTAR
jgi:hypothetical protein